MPGNGQAFEGRAGAWHWHCQDGGAANRPGHSHQHLNRPSQISRARVHGSGHTRWASPEGSRRRLLVLLTQERLGVMIEEDRQERARAWPAIFEHAAFAAGAGGL